MARLTKATPNPRRRVLMVCPRFLPHVGGVETHTYEVGRRLARYDVVVDVITIDETRALPPFEEIDGLSIRRLSSITASGEARIAPSLVKEISKGNWDLIHIQHFHAGVAPLALWAALRKRIPTVITFHGGGQRHWARLRLWPPQPTLIAPFVLDLSRFLLRKAHGLIGVAEFEIEDLVRRIGVPRERFTLIPNGFELPRTPRRVRMRDAQSPHLVSIGRLARHKGHDRVLEAFPHVLSARPRARLWFAGTGPLEEELRRRSVELGVADRVEISSIPSNQRDVLATRLIHMDVLVSMSDFEAHPLSVIEALALGVSAVVADDKAGLSELAGKGLARMVETHASPKELSAAILTALDLPTKGTLPTFPTWDDCARRICEVYDRAFAGTRFVSCCPPETASAVRPEI
jgi:glycosyltransferase involved in cell wall biosynthesis